jgi:hypothetical protein
MNVFRNSVRLLGWCPCIPRLGLVEVHSVETYRNRTCTASTATTATTSTTSTTATTSTTPTSATSSSSVHTVGNSRVDSGNILTSAFLITRYPLTSATSTIPSPAITTSTSTTSTSTTFLLLHFYINGFGSVSRSKSYFGVHSNME